MMSKKKDFRPDCDQILREKNWFSSLNSMKGNEVFERIINLSVTQSMDECFHEHFIQQKLRLNGRKSFQTKTFQESNT
jgi:hypothetical protein